MMCESYENGADRASKDKHRFSMINVASLKSDMASLKSDIDSQKAKFVQLYDASCVE